MAGKLELLEADNKQLQNDDDQLIEILVKVNREAEKLGVSIEQTQALIEIKNN
ncbi:MAG: hypothetical protein NY202_03070 [Mollicutes bacterium UO1]